jgi:hypothetical protein
MAFTGENPRKVRMAASHHRRKEAGIQVGAIFPLITTDMAKMEQAIADLEIAPVVRDFLSINIRTYMEKDNLKIHMQLTVSILVYFCK